MDIIIILGALLLLIGIIGGGFEIKEIKIPKVGMVPRVLGVVLGLVLIVGKVNDWQVPEWLKNVGSLEEKETSHGIKKDSYYRIVAKHSDKSMSIESMTIDSTTTLSLVQSHYRARDSQLFKFDGEGEVYRIISKTKKCLYASKKDGANIILQDCIDDIGNPEFRRQEFKLKEVKLTKVKQNTVVSFYQIISVYKSNKCLDVNKISKEDKANIQLYACPPDGSLPKDNQLWKFMDPKKET